MKRTISVLLSALLLAGLFLPFTAFAQEDVIYEVKFFGPGQNLPATQIKMHDELLTLTLDQPTRDLNIFIRPLAKLNQQVEVTDTS